MSKLDEFDQLIDSSFQHRDAGKQLRRLNRSGPNAQQIICGQVRPKPFVVVVAIPVLFVDLLGKREYVRDVVRKQNASVLILSLQPANVVELDHFHIS